MSLTLIRGGQRPGNHRVRGDEIVPEALRFLAGVALTLLAPAILCCAVTGQWWPLYLMLGNEVIGAALGFSMYRRNDADFPVCVPVVAAAASRASAAKLKRAA